MSGKSEFDCEMRGCTRHGRQILLGNSYSAVLCVRHERAFQHDCMASDEYKNLQEGKDETNCRWGLLRGNLSCSQDFRTQQRRVRHLGERMSAWVLKWVNAKLEGPVEEPGE